MKSHNPYTDITIKEYNLHNDEEIESILEKGETAFKQLKAAGIHQRVAWLHSAADILDENKESYAKTITQEMGKLLTESISEVEKCALVCRYYADHGVRFLMDKIIESDASLSKVSYQPLGAILAVMPWNFPLWQVFRFAAPALIAGNTGLLKHASNVPACALIIEDVFRKAGCPEGSFSTLLIKSDRVKGLIQDKRIKAVTLTGSGPAGRAVASQAAQELKKAVLELGGSDPYIILKDADIAEAAKICAKGRMLNAGQSCIGAKRFIVVKEIFNEFLAEFRAQMESYNFGDPMMASTKLAPMATAELREELHQQVLESVAAGCHLLTGGYIPQDIEGNFYPPTILTEITKESPAYHDEFFGPVASVFVVEDEAEAIQIANDTNFGLGAAIFSSDVIRAEEIAKNDIEAGAVFINAQVKSDPRLPFGGIKESGYGRELSVEGILEFVNIKTIYRA